MSKQTIKQALAVIQTEVNWHAGSDTHYRAERLQQSLATLRAEIKRLEKDAGRYRWLRKGAHDDIAVVRGLGAMDYGMGAIVPTYSKEIDGDDLDAAIDADRAMYEGHGGSRKKILYSAAPPSSVPEQKKLHVGNLATMTDGEYPGLGDWWVQLWDGDEVLARAFGTSPEEARRRAEHIRDALAQQPEPTPEAQAGVAHATAAKDAEIEALRAEAERLNRILGRLVEGDGDSTLVIRVGTDAFAAAREYLRPNTK